MTTRAPGSEPAPQAKSSSLSQPHLTFTRRKFAKSKQKTSPSASHGPGPSEVKERPLRERVLHLLVLRPYSRSQLLLRLQEDGPMHGGGDELDSVLEEVRRSSSGTRRLRPTESFLRASSLLTQVGELSRGGTFVLKSSLFKDVQKDWPGYTARELQLLKRSLIR